MLQATTYLSQHAGVANPANTYIIFIGANDYLNTVNMTATATVANVVQAINQTMTNLYNGGARQYVQLHCSVLNLSSLVHEISPWRLKYHCVFTVTTEYMYLCTFADHEHLLLHMHLMFVGKLACVHL